MEISLDKRQPSLICSGWFLYSSGIRSGKYTFNPNIHSLNISVSSTSQGEYGVDEGVLFSFPTRREAGRVHVVEGLRLNDYSQGKFNETLAELRSERDIVKGLGLLD